MLKRRNSSLILDICLLNLRLTGAEPITDRSPKLFVLCLRISMFFVALSMFTETALNFSNRKTVSRTMQLGFGWYQIFWKYATLISKRTEFKDIFMRTKSFWNRSELNGTIKQKVDGLFKITGTLYYCYCGITYSTIFNMIVGPIVFGKPLTLVSYRENDPFYWTINYILQIGGIPFLTMIVMGFDGLFLYFVISAVGELRVIRKHFTDDLSSNSEYLSIHINHHIGVIRYVNKLNKVYSVVLLNQIIPSLIFVCLTMFVLTTSQFRDYSNDMDYIGQAASLLIQLFIYTSLGKYLEDEGMRLANIFLHAQNYLLDLAYKDTSTKLTIMMMSQKPLALSIGGFGPLNLRCFKMVITNVSSFYAFASTLYYR